MKNFEVFLELTRLKKHIGFLMNELSFDHLDRKLENSEMTEINPLKMSVIDVSGKEHSEIAINEVALTRTTYQAAKLKISIAFMFTMNI